MIQSEKNCANFVFSQSSISLKVNLFMQKAITEKTDQPIARSSYNN